MIGLILATIITGNASATTAVTNEVSGGDVVIENKIIHIVNGKTEELTSTQSGKLELITVATPSASPISNKPVVEEPTNPGTFDYPFKLLTQILAWLGKILKENY